MLAIKNLNISVSKKTIVNHLNINLDSNQIVGLIAPNGYGKTTLLRAISGLNIVFTGDIKYLSYSPNNSTRNKYLKNCYFLQSNNTLYPDFTVSEHISLISKQWNSTQNINNILNLLKMNDYSNIKVEKLSLGMRQHLLIAMAIISDAKLILMDEPMNGLDPTSVSNVSDILLELKSQGKLILFSSHILNNIDQVCDRVIFLNNGNIHTEIVNQGDFSSKKIYDSIYNSKE